MSYGINHGESALDQEVLCRWSSRAVATSVGLLPDDGQPGSNPQVLINAL
jgi:hypothetical protein